MTHCCVYSTQYTLKVFYMMVAAASSIEEGVILYYSPKDGWRMVVMLGLSFFFYGQRINIAAKKKRERDKN